MGLVWKVGKGGRLHVASLDALNELLLVQRGVDDMSFFEVQYDRDIHDPMLMLGMDKAVKRIYKAIENKESIVVYGDYDADGITSTAVLVSTLRDLGAKVTPFLPHRMDDGYGLNMKVLKGLSAELDLLITVDCGISNGEEIKWLKGKGDFQKLRAAYAWSCVPIAATDVIWIFMIALFGAYLFLSPPILLSGQAIIFMVLSLGKVVFSVWSLVIYINALSEVQQFSILRAIGNIILAAIILWIVFTVLWMLAMHVFGAPAGVASASGAALQIFQGGMGIGSYTAPM